MSGNPYDKAARYVAKLDPNGLFAWLLAEIWYLVEFVGWLDTRILAFPGEPDRVCDTVGHLRERAPPEPRAKRWRRVPVQRSEADPAGPSPARHVIRVHLLLED